MYDVVWFSNIWRYTIRTSRVNERDWEVCGCHGDYHQSDLSYERGIYLDIHQLKVFTCPYLVSQGDDIWLDNVKSLMDMTGDIPLGLYETPVPQVR